MLSRLLSFVHKDVAITDTADIQTDTHSIMKIEDEIDQLAHDIEGDSLIIDEARSGPIVQHQPQYGTSFLNAINFASQSNFKIVKFNSEVDFLSNLTAPKNDYELKINRFYLPAISKRDVEVPVNIPEYKYSVDEKLQEIEREKKAKLSKVEQLSPDELQQVKSIFSERNSSRRVQSMYQIDLTVKDIQTLRPGKWLNDNIIDFYLNLISDQNPKYYSWTSHFFTTLQERGYQGVKRWSKRRKLNLFEKDLIFIPINISSTHWALAVINNVDKTIQYFDSLSSYGGEFSGLHLIKSYMEGEKERLGFQIDIDQYKVLPNAEVPQQQNGFDCGVFSCICASYISRLKPLTYSQKDMPLFRQRMVYEILNGCLLD